MTPEIGFLDWLAVLGLAVLVIAGLYVAAHAVLG
jgi:hypothetical protein